MDKIRGGKKYEVKTEHAGFSNIWYLTAEESA